MKVSIALFGSTTSLCKISSLLNAGKVPLLATLLLVTAASSSIDENDGDSSQNMANSPLAEIIVLLAVSLSSSSSSVFVLVVGHATSLLILHSVSIIFCNDSSSSFSWAEAGINVLDRLSLAVIKSILTHMIASLSVQDFKSISSRSNFRSESNREASNSALPFIVSFFPLSSIILSLIFLFSNCCLYLDTGISKVKGYSKMMEPFVEL
mmetsp:Transcript_28710/g.28382  ORF Transcript_28710/g.28382 Transcript_28710/m.28382 type:complete len:209 (+) Transcript_28710:554-1180(+)